MNIFLAWTFLTEYFRTSNQDECFLYYNIKKNKFLAYSEKFKKKEYHVYLGIWSRKADFDVFKQSLEEMKYKTSLYEVTELTKKARKELINDVGPEGFDYAVPDLWFKTSSWTHDLMYYIGGSKQDKDFADKVFLWKMQSKTTGFRKIGFFFPNVYYFAVKYFGKKSFCFRKEKLNIITINNLFPDKK